MAPAMNADRIVPELRAAVAQADHPTVADQVERHWVYVLRSDPSLLGRALARLPHESTRATHHLVRELLHPEALPGPTKGTDPVAEAVQALPVQDDPQLEVSTGLAALHALRRQGRFAEALQLSTQLVGPASRLPATDSNSLVSSLYLLVGNLFLLRGEFRDAERWFEAAYRRPSAFPNHLADAAGRLALVCTLRGETARAEGWLERATRADNEALPWPMRASERLPQLCARAMLALDRLDWAAYHEHDDRIEAERIDLDEQWMLVLHHRALAAVIRGNQRVVLDDVADYRNHHPQYWREPNLGTTLVETAETALLMTVGQHEEALTRLDAAGASRTHLASLAHLLLAGGRLEQAAEVSDPQHWPARTTRRQQVLMLLAHAGAQHRLGRSAAAVAALRQAVNLTSHRSEAWLYNFAVLERETLVDLAQQVPELDPVLELLERRAPVQRVEAPEVRLTPREVLVLQHLSRGLNIQQISEQLFVSPSTVKNQRKSIYRKLGASTREQAVTSAVRMGLVKRVAAALRQHSSVDA